MARYAVRLSWPIWAVIFCGFGLITGILLWFGVLIVVRLDQVTKRQVAETLATRDQGWGLRDALPRSPAIRRAQHGPRRSEPVRRHGPFRAQDGERLPPLPDRHPTAVMTVATITRTPDGITIRALRWGPSASPE